jgi:Arc/MetJ family transcription regulator
MRTTIALDDDLIRTAQEYTGLTENSALTREALKALIEREAARRLAELGARSPDMAYVPRRRPKAKWVLRIRPTSCIYLRTRTVTLDDSGIR